MAVLVLLIFLFFLIIVLAVSPAAGVPTSPRQMSPPHVAPGRPPSVSLDMLDADALITVEIFLVSANCPSNEGSGEALQIASIQFNNLDIIGMCYV